MSDLLTESSQTIEVLHDHNWRVVLKVMEDTGKPAADGLRIAMHLGDMLPTTTLDLALKSVVPVLTGFTPEVYAAWPKSRMDLLDFSHAPPPQSDWRAMHVLCKEILRSTCGQTDRVKAIQPTLLFSMANISTIGVKAAEAGASNGPSISRKIAKPLSKRFEKPQICSICFHSIGRNEFCGSAHIFLFSLNNGRHTLLESVKVP